MVQQKTGKEQWVPLARQLLSIIEEVRASDSIFLMPGLRKRDKPMTAKDFKSLFDREILKPALAPIREAGLVPHGLCKNAHNRLFDASNTAKDVEAVTGRSQQMVAHYSKAYDQRKAARRAIGNANAMPD